MTLLKTLQATLDGAHEPYTLMHLQDGSLLCVMQRGGRVIGIFPSEDRHNLLWTNPALDSVASFQEFATQKGWNLGGERIWIAPEVQYIIRDRSDFWGTHTLPEAIDPGHYVLSVTDNGVVHLKQSITLSAYNLAEGEKSLDVERTLTAVPDPLRYLDNYADVTESVSYTGYAQTVTLTETNDTPIVSESWNLTQLIPGGKLYLPVIGPVSAADYFGTIPEEARTVHNEQYLALNITGKQQYKIGYKALCISGRMAYLNTLPDGTSYLLVRHFDNHPGAAYTEEPPNGPGSNGYSVHVYNDDGGMGGFGEMECSGRAIGGETGRKSSTDTFTLWAYTGDMERLKDVLYLLTGIRL